MIAADRDLDGYLNFNEYLLVRKALIGWQQCATFKMNKSDLKCALTIIQPFRLPEQAEIDMMAEIATMTIKEAPHSEHQISFQQFVLLADI